MYDALERGSDTPDSFFPVRLHHMRILQEKQEFCHRFLLLNHFADFSYNFIKHIISQNTGIDVVS